MTMFSDLLTRDRPDFPLDTDGEALSKRGTSKVLANLPQAAETLTKKQQAELPRQIAALRLELTAVMHENPQVLDVTGWADLRELRLSKGDPADQQGIDRV